MARDPGNDAYLTEVAYAHSNLGTLELKVNHFKAAAHHYRETASINRSQIAVAPDDLVAKHGLAVTMSWLGEIASRSGDINSAASWFRQEYDLRTLIVSLSDDMAQVEHLASAATRLAHEELLAGQLESATEHLEEANDLGRRLVQHDEENTWWRQTHAATSVNLSQVAAAKGDLSAARIHIDAAIAEIGVLGDTTDFQVGSRLMLLTGQALAQRARVFWQSGDRRAHDVIKEALTDVGKLDLTDPEAVVVVAGLRLLDGDLTR